MPLGPYPDVGTPGQGPSTLPPELADLLQEVGKPVEEFPIEHWPPVYAGTDPVTQAPVDPQLDVPEPGTAALWCAGLFAAWFVRRRRAT